jgi:putative Holliday junction resolvase
MQGPSFPDPSEFVRILRRGDRLMGLDLGSKTIGLAISDAEQRLASPLQTLARTKFAENSAEILRLAEHYQVAGFVLGLPLNMDGSRGPRVQATRAFARNLAGLTRIPILFQDERLSTAEAAKWLRHYAIGLSKKAATIDAAAAAIILDDFLKAQLRGPGS